MKTQYKAEDLLNNEKRNKRRLAKIHKLKRENHMLASKRNRIIDKEIDQANLYNQISGYSLYLYSIKLCRISEEIGKNSARIQRLRTLIKQNKLWK